MVILSAEILTGFLGVSYSDLMIEQGYRMLFLTLKIALSFVKLRI